VVNIDEYSTTPWVSDWRHLKVMADPWVQGTRLSQALYNVRAAAINADQHGDKGLRDLDQTAKELERQVSNYIVQVAELQREVGYLVAAVTQARYLASQKGYQPNAADVELKERQERDHAADLGVDRLGALYGIPEPKERR
jgi:hypothetical protein